MNFIIKSLSRYMLCLGSILFLMPNLAYSEWENSFSIETPAYSSDADDCCRLNLIFDRTFSSIVGADLMIFALRGYEALDDCLIPSTQGDRNAISILGRFTKLIFENVLTSTLMVTQHEVFGHGARAREFHLPVLQYRIAPFTGSTSFPEAEYLQLPIQKRIAITAGGMEGNAVLANRLRERFLYCNRIDSREASLYLLSNFDQLLYINTAHKQKYIASENDVHAYVKELNSWYGRNALSTGKLRSQVLIDYLDPFFYYSLYSLGVYVFEGTQTFCDYPMFNIGDYRYLPAGKLALTPYGPEYQLLNYLKTPDHFIQATLRYGNTSGQHSTGITLNISRIWTSDLLFLDTTLALWNQPKLLTAKAKSNNNRLGFATYLTARYQVVEKIEVMGQIGYKTTGYMQGEPLKASVIGRIGLAMQL